MPVLGSRDLERILAPAAVIRAAESVFVQYAPGDEARASGTGVDVDLE